MSDPFNYNNQNNSQDNNNFSYSSQDNNIFSYNSYSSQDNNAISYSSQDNNAISYSSQDNEDDYSTPNDSDEDDAQENDANYQKQRVNLHKLGIVEYKPSDEPEIPEEMMKNGLDIVRQSVLINEDDFEKAEASLLKSGYTQEQATYIIQKYIAQSQTSVGDMADYNRSGGNSHLVIGIICLLAGILLTLFSVGNAIWYGAIVVGIIEIIRGLLGTGK